MIKKELEKCVKDNSQYTCQNSIPIYRVNTNAPCEVQMHTQRRSYRKHIFSTNKFWITLNHFHFLLYSIAADQQITVECDGRHEQRITIRNTGRLELKDKCKLTTDNTVKRNNIRDVHGNVPELNITLLRDQKTISNDNDIFQSSSQHRAKLSKLQVKLEEINDSIEENNRNFFLQKQFMYPMASSGIITIIIIIIVVYIKFNGKIKGKTPDARYSR